MNDAVPPAVAEWTATEPRPTGAYEHDVGHYGTFWRGADALIGRLPAKPRRGPEEAAAAATILAAARQSRERFLAAHAERVYDRVTGNCARFVRVEDLVFAAANAVPGLVPTREQVAAEAVLDQGAKDGVEVDQGIFLAHMLAHPRSGFHLCHAMLLPRPESVELATKF